MSASLKLLYVDDDADVRTIATMALALDPAIEVRAVPTGAEALAMLDADRWRPDAVLLDVMMPEMDGPTLLRELRKRCDFMSVPILFMTARSRDADVARYLAEGAAGVIMKPFDPLGLAAEVRAKIAAIH